MKLKAVLTALLVLVIGVVAAGCGGSSSDSGSSGGVVHITLWHGDVDVEGATIKSMVARVQRVHPDIQVKVQYDGNSGLRAAEGRDRDRGGDPPDISYLYGSWAANIAQSPKVVDLNDYIKKQPLLRLERLLSDRARGGHRGRQDRRHPGARRQPGTGLQQEAVQGPGHLAYPNANWTWTTSRTPPRS